MQKVRVFADKSARYAITDLLHEKGWMQIQDISKDVSPEIQEYFSKENNDLDLQIANIEFAIHFLNGFTKSKIKKRKITQEEYKKFVNAYYYKDIVEKCLNLEEELVKSKNHLAHLDAEEITLRPWEKLTMALKEELKTDYTIGYIGAAEATSFETMKAEIEETTKLVAIHIVNEDQVAKYIIVIADKSISETIAAILQKYNFSHADFLKRRGNPAEELDRIRRNRKKTGDIIKGYEKEAGALASEIENLSVIFDYLTNVRDWKGSRKKFMHTDATFAVEGWVPCATLTDLERGIERITKAYHIEKIENPEDQPPVEIENNALIAPFESVTRIYGLPLSHEVDPTPFLAVFFIVYFGLCLTDAGYGLMLFVFTALALVFMEIPEGLRKLVKLLMFGGIVTFVLGVIFGGYFGLDATVLPEWLTYTKMVNGVEVKMFVGQLINPVKEPLIVLGLAFFLGYIQGITGKLIDGWWKITHGQVVDGLLDGWLWAFALLSLGSFVATKVVPALIPYGAVGKYAFLTAIVLLILTQGRKKKSIIGKLLSGVLSLYSFVGYISDILSYSRLLALGLATGIIAMSINLIAQIIGDMIPFVGPLVMVVILIGGHIFNLALNALGAFIHSGRLQFVEFFGKFMEGGGTQFKPFKKQYKYTSIVDEK